MAHTRISRLPALPSLMLATAVAGCAAMPRRATSAAPRPLVAPLVVAPTGGPAVAPAVAAEVTLDAGELELTLRGRPFGHERFSIARRGDRHVLRTEVQLTTGGLRLLDGELVTDRAWRPLGGRFRDVKDGGTIGVLDGAPLTLASTAPFAPPSTRTASRPVELFLADNTLSHFAPLCAIAAPARRVAFPGMDVVVGADAPVAASRLARRTVDLGGTMRAVLLCEAGRLIAVDLPVLGLAAVRTGRAADVVAAAPPPPPRPALAAGLRELPRDLRVRASRAGEAAVLACALVLPAGAGDRGAAQVPGVVLLGGSGAQDRDGDSVGPGGVKLGLLRVLAGALGQAGVASLRCDDRGTAASTGTFGAATLDTFVGDAAAMVAALRREPALDASRLVVLGHSEGAVVAPRVAARVRGVAALVLLAGPARPIDVVLLEQVEHTLRRAGVAAPEVEVALAHHRAAFAAIRAGAALPDTAEAREWAGGEAWVRSHLRHDVRATAATLGALAVMIAQGEVDQQVAPGDATLLADAFRAGGGRVVLARYPALNHNFVGSTTGDVTEYVDPAGTIDAGFVADVVAFVRGAARATGRAASSTAASARRRRRGP